MGNSDSKTLNSEQRIKNHLKAMQQLKKREPKQRDQIQCVNGPKEWKNIILRILQQFKLRKNWDIYNSKLMDHFQNINETQFVSKISTLQFIELLGQQLHSTQESIRYGNQAQYKQFLLEQQQNNGSNNVPFIFYDDQDNQNQQSQRRMADKQYQQILKQIQKEVISKGHFIYDCILIFQSQFIQISETFINNLVNYEFSVKSVYKNSTIIQEQIKEDYIGSNNESIVSCNSDKNKCRSNTSMNSQENQQINQLDKQENILNNMQQNSLKQNSNQCQNSMQSCQQNSIECTQNQSNSQEFDQIQLQNKKTFQSSDYEILQQQNELNHVCLVSQEQFMQQSLQKIQNIIIELSSIEISNSSNIGKQMQELQISFQDQLNKNQFEQQLYLKQQQIKMLNLNESNQRFFEKSQIINQTLSENNSETQCKKSKMDFKNKMDSIDDSKNTTQKNSVDDSKQSEKQNYFFEHIKKQFTRSCQKQTSLKHMNSDEQCGSPLVLDRKVMSQSVQTSQQTIFNDLKSQEIVSYHAEDLLDQVKTLVTFIQEILFKIYFTLQSYIKKSLIMLLADKAIFSSDLIQDRVFQILETQMDVQKYDTLLLRLQKISDLVFLKKPQFQLAKEENPYSATIKKLNTLKQQDGACAKFDLVTSLKASFHNEIIDYHNKYTNTEEMPQVDIDKHIEIMSYIILKSNNIKIFLEWQFIEYFIEQIYIESQGEKEQNYCTFGLALKFVKQLVLNSEELTEYQIQDFNFMKSFVENIQF